MKKNVMMRVASVLLVAVMLTTCVISGTFAKYVTSDDATDTARVAKWGVTVSVEGTLFATTYKSVGNSNIPGVSGDDAAALTVVSSDTDKLVAPGTQSNAKGFVFTLSGDPEVDVNVDIDLAVTNEIMVPAGTVINASYTSGADYYPIIFTLKKDGTSVATGKASDIQDYFDDISTTYNANEMNITGEYVLTWAWAIENTVGASENVDALDTYLGNTSTADMTVTFTCIVTQVD